MTPSIEGIVEHVILDHTWSMIIPAPHWPALTLHLMIQANVHFSLSQ